MLWLGLEHLQGERSGITLENGEPGLEEEAS